MINIERFNAEEEFNRLLAQLPSVPANIEIVEKTGFSPSQVSGIMQGKVNPSKKFVDAFKKGFKLESQEIKKPTTDNSEWASLKAFNEHLLKENEFLKAMLLKK